jgi:hypothetical protein
MGFRLRKRNSADVSGKRAITGSIAGDSAPDSEKRAIIRTIRRKSPYDCSFIFQFLLPAQFQHSPEWLG